MGCSTPGLPVQHQLPEFTQTHVPVGDVIRPSHPLPSPFSSCPQSFPESGYFSMNKLFASGGQSIGDSLGCSILLFFVTCSFFSLKDLLIFLVCWFIGDVLLGFDSLRTYLSLNSQWWSSWVEYPHFFSFFHCFRYFMPLSSYVKSFQWKISW